MMRKFTVFWLPLVLILSLSNCSDDEVSAPPASAVDVDVTSGLLGETEFTFTIDQVTAHSIALWPEGVDSNAPGIPVSSFTGGKATVKYKYSNVGTFEPVVVSANYNKSGGSSTTTSASAGAITITSKSNKLTAFNFGIKTDVENTGGNVKQWSQKSIRTVIQDKIDGNTDTVTVTVPFDFYGGAGGRAAMIASFTSSASSTVKVGSTNQESEVTANGWTTLIGAVNASNDLYGPVTYTVTAHNGTDVRTYLVRVNQIVAGSHTSISTISVKTKSKGYVDKAFPGYTDSLSQVAVIHAPYGTAADKLDSLAVAYGLSSSYSTLKLAGNTLAQDAVLNMTTAKVLTATAQNGTTRNYDLYAAVAPKLTLTFGAPLNPVVTGSANNDFALNLDVLAGTDKSALVSTFDITLPAGITLNSITVKDGDGVTIATPLNGIPSSVDFSGDRTVTLNVTNGNISETYEVKFAVAVKTIP